MDKTNKKIGNKSKIRKIIRSKWQLLLMFALPFAWYIIFCYVPMYGIQLGFRDYNPRLGIWEALLSGFGGSNSFFPPIIGRTLYGTRYLSAYIPL
ncbi:MAG: hypothetical protein ACLUOI_21375 [Eisenbergiella sp.]